ncbi:putative pyridine nucleotide-disulfide oxidoreductase RclA [Arenibacter antarcticus]|uniref:Mercuric reductase n=1 Tax=Arenibacter antarcticus TaxID=2040469 RepID=A0ABW5VFK6_9FLAO|nr:mercuric reductase [Arenibacter sp. H213]MCM4168192.1 pyruvate/2-oxoglutarate dehydrogenase complex dihydrolipoamide dehydrogenase [Arenibacter sp. H213]
MNFDAIIIGTGQAGPPLAQSLAEHGQKIAIIEKDHLGGTCVNVGCTPTKSYVASARRAFIAGNSSELGVTIKGDVLIDLKKIKQRKDGIVQDSRNGLEKMLTENKSITLIRGKASFVNNHTIEVNGDQHTADKIYINVGARPYIPNGFKDVPYLTNESILELEEIPEHLVIVGGGYIGLEFGQMFRRFGSKVTILEKGGELLKKEDGDISDLIAEIMEDSGVEIKLKSDCIGAKKKNDHIEATFNCDDNSQKLKASHLLLATGRTPNTDYMGLENTGIKLTKHGYIKVDDTLLTSVDHIWALGDCNGEGAFTHTAYNDFQIVNSQLFLDQKRFLSDRFTCYAAFIDPPLARVGMNQKDIQKKGLIAKVSEIPMSKIARAKEMGETKGKLKIFLEVDTDSILGATFIGAGADEYIHTIIDQMYAGSSYQTVRDAIHIHPTISELIPTMLENSTMLRYFVKK